MKKINKDIIPLLISILLVLGSFMKVFTSDYVLNEIHYAGIGCLMLSTLLYFIKKKAFIFVFTLTLIAGLFGLIDFFYATYKIGFREVGMNPIFILLIILFVFFGKDTMNELFPEKERIEKE